MTTFEELYEQTADTVASYVLRRCDPSDAADVISETYVIAWRKHAHTAPNPIGYLLLTARRVLDRTRRSQVSRHVTAERLYRLMSHSGPSAEDVALRRREIADALASLIDVDREALLLTAWDGLSSAEAGEVLGLSAGAVRVRVHRASSTSSTRRGRPMPDMYDDLVAARPAVVSELLPADTPVRVSAAIHRARRRRVLSRVGAGTAVALVAGFALWQGVPRVVTPDMAGSPKAATPSPTVSVSTAATGAQRAVVVTTPTPLTATIEPRPLANRRVAAGATLLQVDGGPLVLCAGAILSSWPPQCSGNEATGVSWDQIPWKERGVSTTGAVVHVVGVLSGTGMSSPLAVEQIGPAGTFVVTSDSPAPDLTMPTMTCLRSSDRGGGSLEANGLETVSGYQAAWTDGTRFNVATLAEPALVESQVRALGYQGPLCIGSVPGPSHSELVAAQQSVVALDGVSMTSVSLNRSLHLEVGVVASTLAVMDQIQGLIRAKSPTASVVVTPEFLAIV